MTIGEAIDAARAGHLVRRPGWDYVQTVRYIPALKPRKAYLQIMCADGELMPWTPLSWDLLADDWELVAG